MASNEKRESQKYESFVKIRLKCYYHFHEVGVMRIKCDTSFVLRHHASQTMHLSNKMLSILIHCISMIVTTSANYCEWGYCSPSEHCCGDNECCGDTKTTWILIICLLTALVVASVCCACLYRHIDSYFDRSRWRFFSSSSEVQLIIPEKA